MLRVVVYDDETMEPITAITLERWMFDRLRDGDRIRIAYVVREIELAHNDIPKMIEQRWAEVWFEKFVRKGQPHWFCFTREGEHAVRLKSTFLAGQISEVQRRERDAFASGAMMALEKLLSSRR